MRKNPKEKKHPRIRRRVFAYLAAFVAFVLALLWLMQIVWLDDFYRWDKTRQITQAADAVESNIGNAQLSALMDRLAQQNDVCILLLDSDKHVFLSSDDIHYCLIHRMSSRDLSFWCSMIPENGDTLTELFNIAPFGGDQYNSHQFRGNVPKMEDDKKQSLLCARRVTLPDGTDGYLLLNSIITPLDSTVATLRTQLMLITIIVLLGATLLAMLISRKVTRSIVETSEAAHSLSRGQYEIPPHGCEYREMAELNDTLVYAAKELSQVENLQHELIANISHDLRTPLTMIGGYVEMMRDIPGEATPEQAHTIGVELAQRLLGGRYEVVVATHLDRAHLHNHVVFNAVSFVDGRMYRDTFRDYYEGIRGVSDALCREHGLSIIEPSEAAVPQGQYQAQRHGRTTLRDVVRRDVDEAIRRSYSYADFFREMRRMGYQVKSGANVKHTAVRPPDGQRFIRLDSLGDGYDEAAIRGRIKAAPQPVQLPRKIYRIRQRPMQKKPLSYFQRLYLYYLYLLSSPRRKAYRTSPALRREVLKLDRYQAQFRYLRTNRIETRQQLTKQRDALQAEMDALTEQRRQLYLARRRGVTGLDADIAAYTDRLRILRREWKQCCCIETDAQRIEQQLTVQREQEISEKGGREHGCRQRSR